MPDEFTAGKVRIVRNLPDVTDPAGQMLTQMIRYPRLLTRILVGDNDGRVADDTAALSFGRVAELVVEPFQGYPEPVGRVRASRNGKYQRDIRVIEQWT